jgi:prephenate dehydrogenase
MGESEVWRGGLHGDRPARATRPPDLPAPPVGVVGLGAVGTSIGLALRAAGEVTIGYDVSAGHLEQSAGLGAITRRSRGLTGFSGCKAVFVAVPPGDVVGVSRRLLELTDAPVVDVASVKAEIANAIQEPRFIPSHPLRGTHLSGPTAGRKDLFAGGVWAVCPTPWTSREGLRVAIELIRAMGSEPLRLDPSEHDTVIATTSHLPHVAAASLVHVLGARDQALACRMVGDGFLDTTRIARANPSLWADITLHNREEISASIGEMVSRLEAVKRAVDAADREGILAFFAGASRLIEDCLPQQPLPVRPQSQRRPSRVPSFGNRRRRPLASELGGVC